MQRIFFFFQAEDGIRDAQESRGLGDVYKRQSNNGAGMYFDDITFVTPEPGSMVALGAGLLSMVGLIRRKK